MSVDGCREVESDIALDCFVMTVGERNISLNGPVTRPPVCSLKCKCSQARVNSPSVPSEDLDDATALPAKNEMTQQASTTTANATTLHGSDAG